MLQRPVYIWADQQDIIVIEKMNDLHIAGEKEIETMICTTRHRIVDEVETADLHHPITVENVNADMTVPVQNHIHHVIVNFNLFS